MKILLIEPPCSYGFDDFMIRKYFPLGLGYIASALREAGHKVSLFLEKGGNEYEEKLKLRLRDFQPALVGISAMTPYYPDAVWNAKIVRETLPNTTVVLGGHHASAIPEESLSAAKNVDYVVCGEGEITVVELAAVLEGKEDGFEKIDGLIGREGTEIVRNRPRGLIKDIDTIPFPARDLVDMKKFGVHSYIQFGKHPATMISSRGCPYRCAFCSGQLTMGRGYRIHSPEYVLAEIRELVEKYGVDHLVFEDDTFTMKRERVLKIAEGIAALQKKITWYCLSRVDTMDEELALTMKRAGCRMINFGIESGSEEILKKIHKKISLEKALHAVAACRKANLRTQATFILGFPFESRENMKKTLDFAQKLMPTIAIFFPLTPYPGTEAFEYLPSEKRPITVEDWKSYMVTSKKGNLCVVEGMTEKELQTILRLWHRKFYLRPTQIFQMLKTIGSFGELKQILKAFIGFVYRQIV